MNLDSIKCLLFIYVILIFLLNVSEDPESVALKSAGCPEIQSNIPTLPLGTTTTATTTAATGIVITFRNFVDTLQRKSFNVLVHLRISFLFCHIFEEKKVNV